jgi:hypothetical protein
MRKLPFDTMRATRGPKVSRMNVLPLLSYPVQESLRPDEVVAQKHQSEEDQGDSRARDQRQGKDNARDECHEATPDSEMPAESRSLKFKNQELTSCRFVPRPGQS